ncbi:trypsin-like peptidase domain protein [Burkholderia cenocepacia]|uniref:Trypsin-like peptidase domain protein n=1 Tax=Burkholderia cenocepacia TaxID=95486 RepID=A0AAN0RMT8_9BURK|nr:trypsin-like peptidase domain protein [Burkholderia cenocepacia]
MKYWLRTASSSALLFAVAATAQTTREPAMNAPSKRIDAFALEANATGFFVNDDGDLLTARHVVDACRTLFVIKDARVARATVKAVSRDRDLAVVTSAIRPLLAATFAQRADMRAAQPVFAAGYDVLRHMPDRATTLYNAFTRADARGDASDEFTLMSAATHGASGAPVLDQAGRVIGLITDRATVSGDDARSVATRSDAASYVIAIRSDPIKTFLRTSGVPFGESDAPQLEPMQARGPRAATLEAGILCGG